jgi:Holliday junction DNA helicase RuvB
MAYRPTKLEEFIGNERAKTAIRRMVDCFEETKKPLKSMLLTGPAGTGKTTLAEIISNELDAKYMYVNCTAINSIDDFRRILVNYDENKYNVVFMEEAHALPKQIYDGMLSFFEYPYILITNFDGEIVKEFMPTKFLTVIFATTDPNKIPQPIISRLIEIKLEDYTVNDYKKMIKLIDKNGILTDGAMELLATITRNPRQLNQWYDFIETSAAALKYEMVGIVETKNILDSMGYNDDGLRHCEYKILEYLNESAVGASINTISAYTNVSRKEILENVEPFLIRRGLLCIGSRGRQLTLNGKRYMLIKTNNSMQLNILPIGTIDHRRSEDNVSDTNN